MDLFTSVEGLQTLKRVFGYENFRGNQQEIINKLIQGENALVLMPTGGGKSLCYQIPSLVRTGVGIVISPLIALMKDQVDALLDKGVEAAYLNSSLSYEEQKDIENLLIQGHLKVLYVSPERAVSTRFRSLLNQIEIALFAIDEAHCVSQWGHDFRPEYMQLGFIAKDFGHIPRVALTATAGPSTRSEMLKSLKLEKAKLYISSFDRPNIHYQVAKKGPKENNIQNLIQFIHENHADECGIVYCLSRKNTEEISDRLNKAGFHAYAYHAGMGDRYRDKVQNLFKTEKSIIIVATIAFGMGIDRADVRFVCHMDLPKSLESYYQETGRAGRDGLPSEAWMLYGLRDLVLLRKMSQRSTKSAQVRRANDEKLDAILGFCETTMCRREVLLNYFNDSYKGPCENCDTCLSPTTKKIDASEEAIIALTAVYETGQKFNVHYLIEILQGIVTVQARKNDHLKLKSFEKGKQHKEDFWFSLYRQLIAFGILKMEMNGSSMLELTSRAIDVIEGRLKVWMRTDYKKTTTAEKKFTSKASSSENVKKQTKKKSKATSKKKTVKLFHYKEFDGSDETIFENLKTFRSELARKKRTKSFKIFPDRTLREIVENRPVEIADMEILYGVGPKKLKKYGSLFLEAYKNFCQ